MEPRYPDPENRNLLQDSKNIHDRSPAAALGQFLYLEEKDLTIINLGPKFPYREIYFTLYVPSVLVSEIFFVVNLLST